MDALPLGGFRAIFETFYLPRETIMLCLERLHLALAGFELPDAISEAIAIDPKPLHLGTSQLPFCGFRIQLGDTSLHFFDPGLQLWQVSLEGIPFLLESFDLQRQVVVQLAHRLVDRGRVILPRGQPVVFAIAALDPFAVTGHDLEDQILQLDGVVA